MTVKYDPTDGHRSLVEDAVAFGLTQADIARRLKISIPTLHKHFRDELDSGKFKLDMIAGKTIAGMMQKATDDRVKLDAARFYAARRMGWKETNVSEQTGKDGGPIETRDVSAVDVIRARIDSTSERLDEADNLEFKPTIVVGNGQGQP